MSRIAIAYERGLILHGDCRERMRELADNSVDSVVTDSPYELNIAGNEWDSTGVAFDWTMWAETMRVLKPGGHLLAFGGSRTVCNVGFAIMMAGYKMKDMLGWCYLTGFPKRKTQLKPAFEPIIMAKKPHDGSLFLNVLKYGTGMLNIDQNRVGTKVVSTVPRKKGTKSNSHLTGGWSGVVDTSEKVGLWPANLLFDHVVDEPFKQNFFVRKPSKKERGLDNTHPTVKPIELMQHLVRLVTPVGGTVLDPFVGSGSTALACIREGYGFIGVEKEAKYVRISRRRITALLTKGTTNDHRDAGPDPEEVRRTLEVPRATQDKDVPVPLRAPSDRRAEGSLRGPSDNTGEGDGTAHVHEDSICLHSRRAG